MKYIMNEKKNQIQVQHIWSNQMCLNWCKNEADDTRTQIVAFIKTPDITIANGGPDPYALVPWDDVKVT